MDKETNTFENKACLHLSNNDETWGKTPDNSISEEQHKRMSKISQDTKSLNETYSNATNITKLAQSSSGINQQSISKERRIISESQLSSELSNSPKNISDKAWGKVPTGNKNVEQQSTWPFDFSQKNNAGSFDSQKGVRSEPMRQDIVSITYEEIGFFPRSFSRVFDRFLKQVFSDVDNLVIQEYRFYRYLFLTTLKCLLILFFVPFIVNYLSKTYLVSPLTEYFWNTQQTEIFLNSYQQKRAFTELKDFEEKLYFESLLHSGSKTNRLEEVSALTKTKLEKTKNSNSSLQQETSNVTKATINLSPLNTDSSMSEKSKQNLGQNPGWSQSDPTKTAFETQPSLLSDSYQLNNVTTFQSGASLQVDSKVDMQFKNLKTPLKVTQEPCCNQRQESKVTSRPEGNKQLPEEVSMSEGPRNNLGDTMFCPSDNAWDNAFFLKNGSQSIQAISPQTNIILTQTNAPCLGQSPSWQQSSPAIPKENQHFVGWNKTPFYTNASVGVSQKSNRQEIFEQRLQEKTIELAIRYNNQSIEAITNFFADLLSFITLCYLLVVLEIQINITKSFLLEVFFGLDDGKKSLLILLITDLLVGYHSSNLWELFFEFLFNHYGLPESQTGIFLLVATLPVLLDVLFKYLIFRHLNRSSPATVATYHAIIE